MSQTLWSAVDEFFVRNLVHDDPGQAALAVAAREELPAINVAPNQGKLLMLLAQIHGARRILEVGTLGGYSTLWLAKALPSDGRIVTLELDSKHARVAQSNIADAGFASQVDVRVGAAAESLAQLVVEGPEPFDMVFIDADKASIPIYYEFAIQLTRPGALIIVDNVVREGAVVDTHTEDENVRGVQRFITELGTDSRVSATAIQTVGSKGFDGFAILRVKESR